MEYLTDGKHKFFGPSGVMMYKATIKLKGKRGKLFELKTDKADIGSAQAEVDMRFGSGQAEVLAVVPVGRNPEFPGMTPWAKCVEEARMRRWLKEKEKEVVHGDELTRAAR